MIFFLVGTARSPTLLAKLIAASLRVITTALFRIFYPFLLFVMREYRRQIRFKALPEARLTCIATLFRFSKCGCPLQFRFKSPVVTSIEFALSINETRSEAEAS